MCVNDGGIPDPFDYGTMGIHVVCSAIFCFYSYKHLTSAQALKPMSCPRLAQRQELSQVYGCCLKLALL